MFVIDEEAPGEAGAREALLDRAMGPGRFAKTSQRLRDGRLPELALVAREDGWLVGSLRLWAVTAAGAKDLVLLGPLAVEPGRQGEGIGAGMMRRALNRATAAGQGAVLLVGDAPYYARFGFTAAVVQNLEMPGPVERHRFLGLELRPGALKEARGLLHAAGIWQAAVPSVVAPPFPAAPLAAIAA
jgi:predicted N-acetyltransferase YhbS